MKFALVNNLKTQAQKDLNGICPNCGSKLLAKCGDDKVHHWAHSGNRNCDPWWESETEWHRHWKNKFPIDWQEYCFSDPVTSEKHIADIYTANSLVIEFQHSFISSLERTSREKFYKNMVWVVDATRLKKDYPRFLNAFTGFRKTNKSGIYLVDFVDEVFPQNWVNCLAPVVFDFAGLQSNLPGTTDLRYNLYCLMHLKLGRYAIVAEFSKSTFIKSILNEEWSKRLNNFLESLKPQPIEIGVKKNSTPKPSKPSTHYYDPKKKIFIKRVRF